MPNNPNFPKARRSSSAPRADDPFEPYGPNGRQRPTPENPGGRSDAELLREELRRSRQALEKLERRGRFSITRVFALLVVILIILFAVFMV